MKEEDLAKLIEDGNQRMYELLYLSYVTDIRLSDIEQKFMQSRSMDELFLFYDECRPSKETLNWYINYLNKKYQH